MVKLITEKAVFDLLVYTFFYFLKVIKDFKDFKDFKEKG
jgi:hypothetical protein